MPQEDERSLIAILDDHTGDVEGLLAENFALQALLLRIAAASANQPALRPVILQAFEEAATFVERVCLRRGHMTEAVAVIERLRVAFADRNKSSSG
jgi:hypothetical protein